MKVIFLDIDGVLNSRAYDIERDLAVDGNIDETRLPLVKQIVDATGACIVLSTTWRRHWSDDPDKCDAAGKYINETFAKYGLVIFDKTPYYDNAADRREEINEWLLENPYDDMAFVILDDNGFGWGELAPHLVKTSPYIGRGLEQTHVKRAIEILNSGLEI